MKLAFIGLGVMGYPMAGHLQQAGYSVTVYNRTTAKAQTWVAKYSGDFASTPAQAVAGADVILMCVGNDQDVRAVVYGEEGILSGMKPNALLIDHTTTSATLASSCVQPLRRRRRRPLPAGASLSSPATAPTAAA